MKSLWNWEKVIGVSLVGLFVVIFLLIKAQSKTFNETEINPLQVTQEGIRTDVLAYIDSKYAATPKIRKATIQLAKSFQKILNESEVFETPSENSKVSAMEISDEMSRAQSCLAAIMDLYKSIDLGKEIEKRTFNNYPRAKLYLKFNGILSGSVIRGIPKSESLCE
jgi:hypothetical protein